MYIIYGWYARATGVKATIAVSIYRTIAPFCSTNKIYRSA